MAVSGRSGCGPVELALLAAIESATGGRPGAYAASPVVLDIADQMSGLGPRYGYEALLDLSRPWIVPVRVVDCEGNNGGWDEPPAPPGFTRCRLSRVGRLVLDAESGASPAVPVGIINGTMFRGGDVPPFDPARVIGALRRIIDEPGTSGAEIVRLAGPPYSVSGCDVEVSLTGLARGRRTVMRETARITVIDGPGPAAAEPGADAGLELRPGRRQSAIWVPSSHPLYRQLPDPGAGQRQLLIESLPAGTSVADVSSAIFTRQNGGRGTAATLRPGAFAALPLVDLEDQSPGGDSWQVRLVVTLEDGADVTEARDALRQRYGLTVRRECALPMPLGQYLRSWVAEYREGDLRSSLNQLEQAISQDKHREREP